MSTDGPSIVSLHILDGATTDWQARVYADVNEQLGRSWWDYGELPAALGALAYLHNQGEADASQTTWWSSGVSRTTTRSCARLEGVNTRR